MNRESLIGSSPFFEACLGPHFREGARNEINFPEDEAYLFQEIKLWVEESRLPDELLLATRFDLSEYLDLYALADKLMVYELQNVVVELIQIQLLATRTVPTMWDLLSMDKYQLLDSSELGRFLTDGLVSDMMDENQDLIDHYKVMLEYQFGPSETLTHVFNHMDAFRASSRSDPLELTSSWSMPSEMTSCRYHIHACRIQEAHCKEMNMENRWNFLTASWRNESRVQVFSILLGTTSLQDLNSPQPSILSSVLNWLGRWCCLDIKHFWRSSYLGRR